MKTYKLLKGIEWVEEWYTFEYSISKSVTYFSEKWAICWTLAKLIWINDKNFFKEIDIIWDIMILIKDHNNWDVINLKNNDIAWIEELLRNSIKEEKKEDFVCDACNKKFPSDFTFTSWNNKLCKDCCPF